MVAVPEEFVDPITQEIMSNPVITCDGKVMGVHLTSRAWPRGSDSFFPGHTYEKMSIKLWLKKHDTSPLTNLPLKTKSLIPNHNLKKQARARIRVSGA